ncbi:MAG TPA: tetratricopeptide repeat protein [Chlorobaculum sp.]|nr:tetratricopeptide repeat protein [Chlorobaculum sp.]
MLNPAQIHSKFEQALDCHLQGKIAQSQALYEEVLNAEPDHVDALHLSGVAAGQTGNHRKAVELIGKAIALYPGNEAFHCNQGVAFNELKEFEAAAASFDKALTIKPDCHEAHYQRGISLQGLNKSEEAVDSYDKAVAIKPDFHEAFYHRGIALQALNESEKAVASYDKAIAIKPDFAEAYANRGNALQELNRFDAAAESFDMAIAIKPDVAETHYNRANALKKLKRYESALASYDKAIAIKPDYQEAYHNLGLMRQELNQLDAAVACFDKAIAIKPDYHDASLHKSLALLLGGNFRQGWALYESRHKVSRLAGASRNFTRPLWLGNEPLAGKTVLLHSEQGFGDTIQFCRYARSVADMGARVVLETELPLIGLLKDLNGVAEVVAKGSDLPEFDYHCPLMSLPLAFKTILNTIPCPHQYLRTDPDKLAYWKNRLGQTTTPRIGLVWSGNVTHTNDSNRSIPLAEVIRHLPSSLIYVSLQKEVREIDKTTLESNANILHFGDELGDFSDTAALCDLMDVVISVDTGIAHLNAALGNTTWVLLPFSPDWRWLLDRDDSPWYQSIRLFRQEQPGDWDGVFKKLRSELTTAYGK